MVAALYGFLLAIVALLSWLLPFGPWPFLVAWILVTWSLFKRRLG